MTDMKQIIAYLRELIKEHKQQAAHYQKSLGAILVTCSNLTAILDYVEELQNEINSLKIREMMVDPLRQKVAELEGKLKACEEFDPEVELTKAGNKLGW